MQKGSPAMDQSKVVTLCVGGCVYTTTLTTLTAVSGSYFATLFGSGRWHPSSLLPGTDTPFIDRDGGLFKYVLGYLRSLQSGCSTGQLLVLPETPLQVQQLKSEAEFYGLPGLAVACSIGRFGSQPSSAAARANSPASCFQRLHLQEHPLSDRHPDHSPEAASQCQPQPQQLQQEPLHAAAAAVSTDAVDLQLRQDQSTSIGSSANGGCSSSSSNSNRVSLDGAILQAQELLEKQECKWAEDVQLQQLANLVLKHLLQLPLSTQQPDLVAALAKPEQGCRLDVTLAYYPVGDLRIELQCRVVPPGASAASAIAAAAAATGAGAAAGTASPLFSPRDGRQQQQGSASEVGCGSGNSSSFTAAAAGAMAAAAAAAASTTGSSSSYGSMAAEVAGAAAAAAAAATAAVTGSSGVNIMPGPGWGGVTMYHRFTIKEAADKFVLTTFSPGEAQQVQEVTRAAFRPELHKYSALHKLCVQQCPRSSVAGLAWLLEAAGFSSVKLSTCLDTYSAGRNTFSGFKVTISLEL